MYTMQLKLKSIKTTALTRLSDRSRKVVLMRTHLQSKYVPHHVNYKAKIGHVNARSLYTKFDEIRCIVDKAISTCLCQ